MHFPILLVVLMVLIPSTAPSHLQLNQRDAETTSKGRRESLVREEENEEERVQNSLSTPTPDPNLRKILRKGYDKIALPFTEKFGKISTVGTTVQVSFIVTYYSIREHEQTLELHGWPVFNWLDPRLRWGQGSHGTEEAGYLHFDSSEIWIPDLVVYNGARPERLEYYGRTNCLVNSTGHVVWVPPSRIDAYCTLNILRWPRDVQHCSVKFGSWSYHDKQVDVSFDELKLNDNLEVDNTEWILLKMAGKRESKIYSCCTQDHYSSILLEFTLKRRSSGYFYCVVLPIGLMCFINVLMFWLPVSGGERITLGALNFFLLSVELMFIRFQLPNANTVPYIVMLCAWNMILATIGMMTTILVSASNHLTSAYALPQFIRSAFKPTLLTLLCISPFPDPSQKPTKRRTSTKGNYKFCSLQLASRYCTQSLLSPASSASASAQNNEEAEKEREMNQNRADWSVLGSIIDRMSFLCWGIVTLFLMITLL